MWFAQANGIRALSLNRRTFMCGYCVLKSSALRAHTRASSNRHRFHFIDLKNSFRFYYRIYVRSFRWLLQANIAGIEHRARTWHTYLIHRFHRHYRCFVPSPYIGCAARFAGGAIGFDMSHVLFAACVCKMKNAQKRKSIRSTVFTQRHPIRRLSLFCQYYRHPAIWKNTQRTITKEYGNLCAENCIFQYASRFPSE